MANIVPNEFKQSQTLHYIINKGLDWKQVDNERIELRLCPFCNKDNYGHFYVITDGSKKDGLYLCHKCGTSGNLFSLKQHFGDKIAGIFEFSKQQETETLPDINKLHDDLLEDEDTLDYLIHVRKFTIEAIQKAKLGLTKRNFKGLGELKALVYPYFKNDNLVFVHYRTLPPAEKAFNSPKGYEAPLYNEDVLKEGLAELIMVEGEPNCIAANDHGIENIVGVPGANFKKSLWINRLDEVNPEKIYICYDTDSVGQRAAQTLASKVGINKCYKIVLPEFTFTDPNTGLEKKGKDLNDWFVAGRTADEFLKLKEEAKLFDVQGVSSTTDALTEFEHSLDGKSSLQPKYLLPWHNLSKLIGFDEADVIDIVAPEKIGKTTFGMNLMDHMVETYNEDGVIICLEMTNIKLVRKWVCYKTQTPDLITQGEASVQALATLKEAIKRARVLSESRPGTLYLCCPQIKVVEDLYKLIHDCIRRYGVKWIMVDNLQLVCDRTLKNPAHRTIHLSQISKELAGIAKDDKVQMVRILQPHRIADGKMISTDDVDGSSQVAKDCDAMLTLWRARREISKQVAESGDYIEDNVTFEPVMITSVGLTRYTGGGYVKLYYEGSTSTVMDYNGVTGVLKHQTLPVSQNEKTNSLTEGITL